MRTLLSFAALCVAPAVVFYGLDRALMWWSGHDSTPRRASGMLPRDRPSLQRLVLDLQRLSEEFGRLEGSNVPAKVHRLEAVTLAYDDVLLECCLALDIPPPPSRPLTAVDRLATEAELARHGLRW